MSDLSRFQHPRFARMYERISADSERRGTAGYRDRVLAGLSGRVIEVGAGNGMNFAHYPETVSEVVAVEPEDRLRVLAADATLRAPVPVTVVAAHADDLPYPDASFDAGVASLVLCSVADPCRSLRYGRGRGAAATSTGISPLTSPPPGSRSSGWTGSPTVR